jgi:hypothetical protein
MKCSCSSKTTPDRNLADHQLRLVIHKHLRRKSVNHKETAEMLASCGLTPDTFGAVAKALIYEHRRAFPVANAETPWQIGFADCLAQLEREAMQVSAEWPA